MVEPPNVPGEEQAAVAPKHWGLSNGMAFWTEVEKLRIDKEKVLDFLQPGARFLTDLDMTKQEAFDRLPWAPVKPDEEQTADPTPDDSYNYAGELEQYIRAAETAAPTWQKIESPNYWWKCANCHTDHSPQSGWTAWRNGGSVGDNHLCGNCYRKQGTAVGVSQTQPANPAPMGLDPDPATIAQLEEGVIAWLSAADLIKDGRPRERQIITHTLPKLAELMEASAYWKRLQEYLPQPYRREDLVTAIGRVAERLKEPAPGNKVQMKPIWELERHITAWLHDFYGDNRQAHAKAMLMLKEQGKQCVFWQILQTHVLAAKQYRGNDLRQAINNVAEQARQSLAREDQTAAALINEPDTAVWQARHCLDRQSLELVRLKMLYPDVPVVEKAVEAVRIAMKLAGIGLKQSLGSSSEEEE
jgi:hypothetical protein